MTSPWPLGHIFCAGFQFGQWLSSGNNVILVPKVEKEEQPETDPVLELTRSYYAQRSFVLKWANYKEMSANTKKHFSMKTNEITKKNILF